MGRGWGGKINGAVPWYTQTRTDRQASITVILPVMEVALTAVNNRHEERGWVK